MHSLIFFRQDGQSLSVYDLSRVCARVSLSVRRYWNGNAGIPLHPGDERFASNEMWLQPHGKDAQIIENKYYSILRIAQMYQISKNVRWHTTGISNYVFLKCTAMSYPYQIKTEKAYHEAWKKSVDDPEGYWSEIASSFLWKKRWDHVLEWNFKDPDVKWFTGAKLNITENCLDRHLGTLGNKPAIIWEANDPEEHHRAITYRDLHAKVVQFANVLKNNGVKKGDRVCIYMGMVPELAIAVLACARVGAVHSVIFGGFSAQSIADRLQDAEAAYIITCDGAYRGNKEIPLKNVIDDALVQCKFVEKVIVLTRTHTPVSMIKGRDVWWEDEIKKVETMGNPDCPGEEMDAEDPLFILYTSGSTGKPKGVVHTCGGYMVYTTYSFVNTFQYTPGDLHFCTADIGWITGHSYILYGPLAAGATTLIFEGVPTWPDAGRFWDIIDKYKVNILYTAPTAIRSLMGYGLGPVRGHDLSSLKTLGSVGEPINEEAWHWLDDNIGRNRCPIVDTWWQTETGGIMISNMAGVTPAKPSYATLPLPGIQPVLVDDQGNEITGNDVSGNLCIKFPWPSIIRTTYGDHERCRTNYFATYPELYFTGDGCYRDDQGNYRITGRVDDVLNVSGHRIGTAEVENAINMHSGVVESAVVGYPHDIKGQGIYAYIVYGSPQHGDENLTRQDIMQTVSRLIGAIAKPDKIQFVTGLPKTRSGKIMRRILRKIAENELQNLGDTSTLLDPGVVDEIKAGRV
ncbi:MAG TPA: acetate--CoA ligase [Flavipsychrobacter sp.]|nr:acetate--CoA ligase [Flavipsychrobacter sp.]